MEGGRGERRLGRREEEAARVFRKGVGRLKRGGREQMVVVVRSAVTPCACSLVRGGRQGQEGGGVGLGLIGLKRRREEEGWASWICSGPLRIKTHFSFTQENKRDDEEKKIKERKRSRREKKLGREIKERQDYYKIIYKTLILI